MGPHCADTPAVDDEQETIPYTVWGSNEKVSLRVSTKLRFHDPANEFQPVAVMSSSWVNYCFEDESGTTSLASREKRC